MGNLFLHPQASAARYFFDTEFIENGRTIDLISIGITTEEGNDYYAVSRDANLTLASPWVRQNVLPHLPPYSDPAWKPRSQIANEVRSFVPSDGRVIEFWAYYADYDWVALCQLFGTMMELPPHWPKFCMDLKQLSVLAVDPRHPKQVKGAHHALADAHYNRELFFFLRDYAKDEP